MSDLAALGYTGVLHTLSENDLAYYRETMGELVAASHRAGLWVQASPWGLGRTFGGEAESRFVTFHPDECQVLDDGRRVAAACLNSPRYRAFCEEWADWALECGIDSLFWDEPAWVVPEHVGVEPERWSCRCHHCAERFGARAAAELDDEVLAFRQASVVDFLREMLAPPARRDAHDLPAARDRGPHGISDWDAVASLPGLTTFATDPYWKHWDEPAGPFVRRFARAAARDVRPPRRRRAALAPELRPHRRRDPRSRGRRSPARGPKGSTTCGRGATRRAATCRSSRRPTRRASGRRSAQR